MSTTAILNARLMRKHGETGDHGIHVLSRVEEGIEFAAGLAQPPVRVHVIRGNMPLVTDKHAICTVSGLLLPMAACFDVNVFERR